MQKIPLGQYLDSSKLENLNRIVLQERFSERVNEVRKVNITLTQKPTQSKTTIPQIQSKGDLLIDFIEEMKGYRLNPENGSIFSKEIGFAGYDESKYKFYSLEGEAHLNCHAIIYYINENLFPTSKISFNFYTRSRNILEKSEFIQYSDDLSTEANRDYAIERNEVIIKYSLGSTIIFIDGPIIGGNITSYSLKLVDILHQKNIIPIFIVKNSDSNLVVDNIGGLQNQFNSDLHWAYRFLGNGERTNLFKYTDRHNINNSKYFCYFKPFSNTTPQRIEFHPDTYLIYIDYFSDLFDLIYYLILVQGDKSNPQLRPIAIAEKYAREVIRTMNVELLLKRSSLVQTMNQSRFGV